MTAWYQYYNPKSGTNVSYNSVGSGAGIASITARTVDFGASDAPLTPDQFSNCKDCVQIPVAARHDRGSLQPPGCRAAGQAHRADHRRHLSRQDHAMGRSGDQGDQPGVNLPSMKITPAYRSDGSGTSYNFTDYLSKVSPEFASKVGKSTQPPFPLGVGARGSSGVAGVVKSTPGAIGYADVAYALTNKLRFAKVRNKAGAFATPGIRGAVAAAAIDQERCRRTTRSRSSTRRRPQASSPTRSARSRGSIVPVESKKAQAGQAVPPVRDQQAGAATRA